MATVVNFHGKSCVEPGSYAVSEYNPTSVVNVSEFGNVMIIDNGDYQKKIQGSNTLEFAGGSGINGELAKGMKSIYQFNEYNDFLSFMGGGVVADFAQYIFTPRPGQAGAPNVYYARAARTTAGRITLTINAGSLVLTCKNEGIAGNGIIEGGALKKGYAAQIVAGTDNPTKFKLQVYRGNYMGVDTAGEPIGSKSWEEAGGEMIAESDEFSTLVELYEFCSSNRYILNNFVVSMTGEDITNLVSVDLTAATGGTTTYMGSNEISDILEAITELDISFFLVTTDSVNKGTQAATWGKVFTFLKQDAKFTEFMVIPGGKDDTDLMGASNTSQAIAKFYNSEQVVVTHGAPIVTRKDGNGTKELPAIYLTANIIGVVAGGQPQTPLTFKRCGFDAFVYDLKKKERVGALQAGIMHVRNINGYWCVNQGVTTLQDNKQTYAKDSQSMEFSIALIKAQLNKELVLDGEQRFVGQTASEASPESVKNFTEAKLASFVATPQNNNLILNWKNVAVKVKNSDYTITYDFTPNVPVNKLFFVGNVLDFTI